MQFEVLMRFVLGLLLGAALWAVTHRARADSIPATGNSQTQAATLTTVTKYNTGSGTSYESPGALQSAIVASRNSSHQLCSSNGSGAAYESASPGQIYSGYFEFLTTCGPYPDGTYQWQNASSYVYFYGQASQEYRCGSGWTLDIPTATCSKVTYSCPGGYTLNGQMCDQNLKPKGDPCGNIAIPATASPGGGGCLNGTLCYFNNASNQYASGGQQMWYGPAVSSGQACSGEPQAMGGTPPPTQCGPGKVPGTINGQTVCFSANDSKPAVNVNSTTQSTTNAQGQSTPGPTTMTTNTDRGTSGATTTTTTKNPDGTSTTTTQSASPSSSKDDISRFCDENPLADLCKTSTWSGACGAFQCDGDAVECAMALEIYKRNCALYDMPTALSTLGNQVAGGGDPAALQNPALEANRRTVNLSGSLSQEAFLSQAGLSDQQFVVSPRLTLTIPWSRLNSYLSLMGGIVVAFALIVAARIVIGAN